MILLLVPSLPLFPSSYCVPVMFFLLSNPIYGSDDDNKKTGSLYNLYNKSYVQKHKQANYELQTMKILLHSTLFIPSN